VGLVALAGGLAAPVSAPVAGALAHRHAAAVASAPAAQPGPVGEQLAASLAQPGADPELAAFYAARNNLPLWTEHRRIRPEAAQLIARLEASDADGLNPSDYRPETLKAEVRAAASGRLADLTRAELDLSDALANWAVDLHRPKSVAAITYSDPQFRPPAPNRRAALEQVGQAPSLKEGLDAAARMNPLYEGLRAALAVPGANAWVIRANMERARALPVALGQRFIMVDVAAQRLWMYQNGRPVDGMKVVVGKPSDPTPQMAAVVRYAVFRPYWNVPPDLAAGVARKVVHGGLGALQAKHLEAMSDWSDKAHPIDPKSVNWKAVASGRRDLRLRQLPGPDNMMGQVKFMFPNQFGVYLHDSPLRAFFANDQRTNSAGCVRLEDAARLGRWLLGDAAMGQGVLPGPPESRMDLPAPVPVYILYLTAAPTAHGLSVRKDIYRRDARMIAQLAKPAAGVTQLASR
jgi:murein L,D-transpeptidase YcbB/YkuD